MSFVSRVVLKNYKSIGACDVRLRPLSLLVGPNGSGKSNFLDALEFVKQSAESSVDFAIRERGGLDSVRRRSQGHPHDFTIRVEFSFPAGEWGFLAFTVSARKGSRFHITHERCMFDAGTLQEKRAYTVQSGSLEHADFESPPEVAKDRLYLTRVSGIPGFKRIFDSVSRMGFYNLNPSTMRIPQSPDFSHQLAKDGVNIASVIGEMPPKALSRVNEYLSQIVPGISAAQRKQLDKYETVEFRQAVAGSVDPWKFTSSEMSDGTLRALGVLVALFQKAEVPLVAIEEPESALHPAATALLGDALKEASQSRQVLVTTHSPDLLDYDIFDADDLLAVSMEKGDSHIGPVDEFAREALRQRLYTTGDLLRERRLEPKRAMKSGFRTESLFRDEWPE